MRPVPPPRTPMMRPAPTDFARYRRLRWRARWATLGFGWAVVVLVRATVLQATVDSDASRWAIVPFLVLCGALGAGWVVLGALWRRSYAARPVVQTLDPTPGELYGIPMLDDDLPRHRGLTGETEVPTRW